MASDMEMHEAEDEIDRLRKEVEELQQRKVEIEIGRHILALLANAESVQPDGTNVHLVKASDFPVVYQLEEQAEAAERERDEARAQVAMLRAQLVKVLGNVSHDPGVGSAYIALNDTATTAQAYRRQVLKAGLTIAAKGCDARIGEIVQEEGSQEPDTGEVNLPEWAETAIEELEAMADSFRYLAQEGR